MKIITSYRDFCQKHVGKSLSTWRIGWLHFRFVKPDRRSLSLLSLSPPSERYLWIIYTLLFVSPIYSSFVIVLHFTSTFTQSVNCVTISLHPWYYHPLSQTYQKMKNCFKIHNMCWVPLWLQLNFFFSHVISIYGWTEKEILFSTCSHGVREAIHYNDF